LGLSSRYATFIAYEAEATDLRNFEPILVPGLLQTEAYARAVNAVGRETETEAIEERVRARMKRQEVLTRKPPLRLHAIVSEGALMTPVGGEEVLREQLQHLIALSRRPTASVQVLRFAAGEHLATHGGFAILSFDRLGDPPLGYIETLAGELFLEAPRDVERLANTYDHLKALALSPAESVRLIKEKLE
jgi:hypothetical protein